MSADAEPPTPSHAEPSCRERRRRDAAAAEAMKDYEHTPMRCRAEFHFRRRAEMRCRR